MHFSLRLATCSDEAFLFDLFAATNGRQFLLLQLPPVQFQTLVRMQFDAQRIAYRQQYPKSEDLVIEAGDEPVGRVWRAEAPEAIRILDIAILPSHQARGIGSAVLRSAIEDAASAGKALRLTVARQNAAALSLYERLGFQTRRGDAVHLELELTPR